MSDSPEKTTLADVYEEILGVRDHLRLEPSETIADALEPARVRAREATERAVEKIEALFLKRKESTHAD